MKSVGLLGGSFDPPHKGHLYISIEAKKILGLDTIWWLVTPQNPLKIAKPATYEERIQNCKKITKKHPIQIKEIEKKIQSNFSYETISFIKHHYSNLNFYWLMGADNLINFHKWQKWQCIFRDIPIVIFNRHGYNTKALKSVAKKTFINSQLSKKNLSNLDFRITPSWTWIKNKEIRISSTEIRKQRNILRGQN